MPCSECSWQQAASKDADDLLTSLHPCLPAPVACALCVSSVGKAQALPTKMLCDFNPRPVTRDVVEYTHRCAHCDWAGANSCHTPDAGRV